MRSHYTLAEANAAGVTLETCEHYTIWESGPQWDLHSYDPNWVGASGPGVCGTFEAESVQSVAVTTVTGYSGAIVAAASPSRYAFAVGYLGFWNAQTLEYLGCQPAGIKPEGIASNGAGQIACINEGSQVRDGSKLIDRHGSMTMCDVTTAPISFACTTYVPSAATFAPNMFKSANEYRMLNLRLYGPSSYDVAYDLEPEGGDFTDDGAYFMVNLQDNNGYMMFDLATRKYLFMAGYGSKAMTMDASDKDNMINIKSTWGATNPVPAYGLYMPDVATSFTAGGTYYFVTANEGDTRDGRDLIGRSGDFEGEEVKYKDIRSQLTCTDCGVDAELGRLLTTSFMPADLAVNSCGSNTCESWQLEEAAGSSFACIYYRQDYGGGNDHPDCGFATMLEMYVDSMDKTGTVPAAPASGSYPGMPTRGATFETGSGQPDTSVAVSAPFTFPGWFSGTTGVDASIDGPASCMAKCVATAACDHWTYEFEEGYHECFLKSTHATAHCQLYSQYVQHWEDSNWEGYSGPKTCTAPAPYTTEKDATDTTGTPGGATSIGGRSFTIWSWDGSATSLTMVYDSGSEFETKQARIAGGVCDGCVAPSPTTDANTCKTQCGFNSDDWPPNMDDRSDAKGPEPECVTTGVMADGTRLAFVGLERTGGIMTYDVSTPASSTFQDFLNVRNWRVGETVDNDEVAKNLNDGPESLVFVSAADSPIGKELLLAATPLAGRLTAYLIEQGDERADDGSCKDTATCPYISVADGGTGEIRGALTVCELATADKLDSLNCPPNSGVPMFAIAIIIGLGALALAVILCICCMIRREKKGAPLFMDLSNQDKPGNVQMGSGSAA